MESLPRNIQMRISGALRHLCQDPRPAGSKKLSGQYDIWRIRIANYRVLYRIESERLVIFVVKVGHRREVYR